MSGNVNLRRVAVIDCGTNTFNLRIVDIVDSQNSREKDSTRPWINVFSLRIPVKLGKGGIGKNIIRPDRIARGLDAIGVMKETINNYVTNEVYVIATSALRDASNSSFFVDQTLSLYGYNVIIISGAAEAELIQTGLALTFTPAIGECALTMDIGGGSTECILWNNEKMFWSRSFDVGVARLDELFKMSDKFGADTEEAYNKMLPYLNDVFDPLKIALENVQPTVLIGSSGSFDTFYSVLNPDVKKVGSNGKHPSAIEIDITAFEKLSSQFMHNTLKERLSMSGMPPDRAAFIPYASAIVRWVMSESTFHKFYRSKYALREGVLNRLSRSISPVPGMSLD
jgi:exopolyphosphatase/guanosine-5'-triphosphate,3'-diphosphate pyrophosphatase